MNFITLMKDLGYGDGYQYAHDFGEGKAENMQCLPEELQGRKYYHPKNKGFEGKFVD